MTTERLQVSIVAAPLGAIDRRELSQAWYSALHLERGKKLAAAQARPASRAQAPVAPSPARLSAHASRVHAIDGRQGKRETRLSVLPAVQPDTTAGIARPAAMRSNFPLSRRIERTFSRPGSQLRRATFALGRGGARVHVILQSNAGTVTLVALCPPEMRAVVVRALARARLALARRGFTVSSPVQGEASCF